MMLSPKKSPLVVTIVGEEPRRGRCAATLSESVHGSELRCRDARDVHGVVADSARSHLVLGVGDRDVLSPVADLIDAYAPLPLDDAEFVERARAFDERRRAHRPPPDSRPEMVEWSHDWATVAARVGARVLTAMGREDVVIDHVGSTSVPGLLAKDIIDLQVSVTRLNDSDASDRELRAAGFVNVQELAPDAPGVMFDNPRGEITELREWAKRLYASVDAEQRVIVHVRQVGSPGWRYALLFRDWLRADSAARDEYAAVKSKLAAAHAHDSHFDNYARAKDFWFADAFERSERWAQETSWSLTLSRTRSSDTETI